MARLSINPCAHEIQERFFLALDTVIKLSKIDCLSSFCRRNSLNRVKYSRMRNSATHESNYKLIDIDALSAICRDFNVSPEWLLLGQGKMLSDAK